MEYFILVAQMEEHRPSKPTVAGSSPVGNTFEKI